ncbi:hypothetical protein [Aurantibacter sp.]|uniref:hypothetical protein n=1 Tax=Aurantibacter sp. TaxID=2807103 RepID=UPI003265DFB7
MTKFIKKILFFISIGILIGELITRIFVLTSDIPERYIDQNGIQKYIPNQNGQWIGGEHSWQINKTGWPGPLPKEYKNLITIVGDSYIENFMNPDSCHQGVLLKDKLPEYNFFEASRSGVSLIEAMEITRELDSLNPIQQLIYLGESDFKQSILQIKKHSDITQLDIKKEKVIKGLIKGSFLKKILYNFKFAYYLFNKISAKNTHSKAIAIPKKDIPKNDIKLYHKLLDYIKRNYNTTKVIYIIKPKTPKYITSLLQQLNYNYLVLDSSNDSSWSFDFDAHWTCYGHEKVAQQIADSNIFID